MDFLAFMILVFCSAIVVSIVGWLLVGIFANTMDSVSTLCETIDTFIHRNDDAPPVPTQKLSRHLP